MAHMSPRLKARRGRFGAGGLDPSVSITFPANNANLTADLVFGSPEEFGSAALFTGVATDDIDGDISSSIVWSSDAVGSPAILGTGASIGTLGSPATLILPVGTHVITAQAFPSTGSPVPVVTDSITIVVAT